MRRLGPIFFLAAVLTVLAPAPAHAAFGLNGFDFTFEEQGGAPASAAGSHPFAVENTLHLNFHEDAPTEFSPDGELKDLEVSLPVGFAGNPTATPRCTHQDFSTRSPITETSSCPNSTAIGVAFPEANNPGPGPRAAVFNLIPPPGVAAQIGFYASNLVPIVLDFTLSKTPPYRVIVSSFDTPQPLKVYGAVVKVWGNPASPIHDEERGVCAVQSAGHFCSAEGAPEKPFITLPRACSPPLFTTYSALSWQDPAVPPITGASETPFEVSECEALEFEPQAQVQPTTTAGESSSGLSFDLNVDDQGLLEPDGIADADIEKITTILPAGVTTNPSAAEGLAACSQAQLQAESLAATGGCPEASRLGTLEVQTPLLEDETLGGSVYLASQDDNPFGSLLALYVVIKDPELGILVKQPVRVDLDPASGQITTTVKDMPQVPFSHLRLQLRAGDRAPLITPRACGKYEIATIVTPYNKKPPLTETSSFEVSSGPGGGPCPAPGARPFAPGFSAGTLQSAASTYSPFNMRFTRDDGAAEITRLSATLPAGVVPKLAGVAQCPEAAIAAARTHNAHQELAFPSCPASSAIGQVQSGAGVGPALTYVPGSVYLAGPFGGDPLSAVAIVPALAGPFDVGTVVNRVGLTLNPVTHLGEIDGFAAEPLPRILAGVPLHLRDLRVLANRPDFTLNATGCEAESVKASLFGAAGLQSPSDLTATLTQTYQARGCGSLGFNPKLSLKLSGATKRSGHPQLHSVVTYPYPSGPGYSNIGKAVVTLPPSEFIDQSHINNPCTRVQFNAGQCPANSILGTARATSPLLDQPLEGTVYFRSNGGERELPDIVVALHGIVDIELVGFVDAKVRGGVSRIRTTFAQVPDAPVKKFVLDLKGGKRHGLIENSRDLCASTQKANLKLIAQSARIREATPTVKTSCKVEKSPKHKKRR